ncbi:MAG: TlpA disulfide reductase family protein [Chloroflexi bacterium]|nr:TlpA disulfide reductase family protein [Chloroflexota bacterium]
MATIIRVIQGRLLVIGTGGALLALLAVLVVAMTRDVGQERLGAVDPGIEQVREFTLPTINGDRVAIADFADGPVFVYFWASWCAPCERETPLIERLWAEYEPQGYVFIGINILDSDRGAHEFVERHGLTFPILIDSGGDVYFDFGVNGVPEAYFLEPGLVVTRKYIGELREQDFRDMLEDIRPAS